MKTGMLIGRSMLTGSVGLILVALLLSSVVVLGAASGLNFARSSVADDGAAGMRGWLKKVIDTDFPEASDQQRILDLIDGSLGRKTLTFSMIPDPETGEIGLVVVYIDDVPKIWVSDDSMIQSFKELDIPFMRKSDKGLVSTEKGATPFYTNSTDNPVNLSLSENQTMTVTFWVTPTADSGSYDFFAYALSGDGEEMTRTQTFIVTVTNGSQGMGGPGGLEPMDVPGVGS